MSQSTNHSDETTPAIAHKDSVSIEVGDSSERAGANAAQNETKKHDSGAADLEKVTDYAEEKEILSSSTDLEDAIAVIR